MNYLSIKNAMVFYLVACCLLLVAQQAQAAEMYFGSHFKEVGVQEGFEIGVFINTQSENINAIEGTITFNPDVVDLQGVQNGGSIVSLWIQQPYLLSSGLVTFSGVLPGGFIGDRGYLFSLIFKAKKIGRATFASTDEKMLLNDGTGSEAKVTRAPLSLTVVQKDSPEPFVPPQDSNPPEVFELHISKSEDLFSGRWFLAFATQDKGSGINYYEILEKPHPKSIFSLVSQGEQWLRGESPYLLKDQRLMSVVLVRAYDRAGNYAVAALAPAHPLPWYENISTWIIIVVMGIVLSAIIFIKEKFFKNNGY